MNWYEEMQGALDYIENNLSIKIDLDKIASKANCSSYNFQRLFSFITGLSLAYYIRKRIMTEASYELLNNNASIIDVAYKYGYDSVTAFSRAYKTIEGFSPKDIKKNGTIITSFSPFGFKVTMKGSKEMKFKVEKEKALILSGLAREFTNINGENFIEIPKMWDEEMKSGNLAKLIGLTKNTEDGIYGVCYDFNSSCTKFKYAIMIKSNKELKDYNNLKITEQTYVKFSCLGVKDLQDTTKRIFSEWLPASKYKHADSPELEYYPPHKTDDEEWPCEIWIPVVEK